MPLGFLIIGAILAVSALRNTQRDLGALVAGDFTGSGNFGYWIAALAIVGGLGYIPTFQGPSRALLGLMVIVLLLSNRGFFAQLNASLSAGAPASSAITAEPKAPAAPTIIVSGGAGSGGKGGIGGILGDVAGKAVGGVVGSAAEGIVGAIGL